MVQQAVLEGLFSERSLPTEDARHPPRDGVDAFRDAGQKIFGPTRAAAQLEASKDFAKSFMARHKIPTAAHRTFEAADTAKAYVAERGAPIVVKADGLAAGKGVVVAQTLPEAEAAVAMMFEGAFGSAGAEVVIEEFLSGREISFFALCDGVSQSFHGELAARLLGDEARLRLLRVLDKDRFNVKELTGILGLAQSGASRHLGLLKEAELVVEERDGAYSFYRLSPSLRENHDSPLWPLLQSQFERASSTAPVKADDARLQDDVDGEAVLAEIASVIDDETVSLGRP